MSHIQSRIDRCGISLLCLFAVILARETDYVGIGLGPQYITASSFAINRSPVPITRIQGNEDYQAYLADTLANEGKRIPRYGREYVLQSDKLILAPPNTHNLDTATKIFTKALQDVKEAVATALSHNPKILTISQPRHFNNTSYLAVARAADIIEPPFQPKQIIRFNTAARLAYNFTACAAFGLPAIDCNIDEDSSYMINVEYHTAYLEIVLGYMDAVGLNVEAHVRYPELGGWVVDNSKSTHWLDGMQGSQRTLFLEKRQKHYKAIEEKIIIFMEEHQKALEGFNRLDDLRAIILSGDASPSAFESLKSAITTAAGRHKDKIRDSIDPLYVGAIGAGERGRHQSLTPGFLESQIDTNIIEHVSHDEL